MIQIFDTVNFIFIKEDEEEATTPIINDKIERKKK